MTAVDIQYACTGHGLPRRDQIVAWVNAALRDHAHDAELTVRLVDEGEAAELNRRWRGRSGPTNVLSFPVSGLEQAAPGLLGDIVVCAPVVEREAEQQGKRPEAHWAHMVIHGTLHLLGYDHENNEEADIMESLEATILAGLGFPNPYE
ncbi:MAG: rRNA maturation RNase YbeY [Gammaproteobacteria bacterium]|nr:rRNA maturation RNase YbeY [Gammaproteobacteria bacterium]